MAALSLSLFSSSLASLATSPLWSVSIQFSSLEEEQSRNRQEPKKLGLLLLLYNTESSLKLRVN